MKSFFEDRPLLADMHKCLRTLKNVAKKQNFKSFAVIRDLAVLTMSEWSKFIDLFDSGTPSDGTVQIVKRVP